MSKPLELVVLHSCFLAGGRGVLYTLLVVPPIAVHTPETDKSVIFQFCYAYADSIKAIQPFIFHTIRKVCAKFDEYLHNCRTWPTYRNIIVLLNKCVIY